MTGWLACGHAGLAAGTRQLQARGSCSTHVERCWGVSGVAGRRRCQTSAAFAAASSWLLLCFLSQLTHPPLPLPLHLLLIPPCSKPGYYTPNIKSPSCLLCAKGFQCPTPAMK